VADKSKVPVAMLDKSRQCYSTPDEAALDVMSTLPPKAREVAFAIYRNQGPEGVAQFCASIGIPGTESNFSMRLDPKAGKNALAALAHTHPASEAENTFSADDVLTANNLNVPSYIRGNGNGQVRRYTPGDPIDAQRIPGSRTRQAGTATGVLVEPTQRQALEAAYDQITQHPNPNYQDK